MVKTEDEPGMFLLISGKPMGESMAWCDPIVVNTQEHLRVAFENTIYSKFPSLWALLYSFPAGNIGRHLPLYQGAAHG
jgi:hypothetical protein